MTTDFVFYAGATQLGIAMSSLFLPRILGWRQQIARLEPLTQHVFWTYAAYILCTNLFFAGVSMLTPQILTDGTTLARLHHRLLGGPRLDPDLLVSGSQADGLVLCRRRLDLPGGVPVLHAGLRQGRLRVVANGKHPPCPATPPALQA